MQPPPVRVPLYSSHSDSFFSIMKSPRNLCIPVFCVRLFDYFCWKSPVSMKAGFFKRAYECGPQSKLQAPR